MSFLTNWTLRQCSTNNCFFPKQAQHGIIVIPSGTLKTKYTSIEQPPARSVVPSLTKRIPIRYASTFGEFCANKTQRTRTAFVKGRGREREQEQERKEMLVYTLSKG